MLAEDILLKNWWQQFNIFLFWWPIPNHLRPIIKFIYFSQNLFFFFSEGFKVCITYNALYSVGWDLRKNNTEKPWQTDTNMQICGCRPYLNLKKTTTKKLYPVTLIVTLDLHVGALQLIPTSAFTCHSVYSPFFPQSPARPLASPASWTASLTSLWCRGPAQLVRSSTSPQWRRKTANQKAAGLTASSVACQTSTVDRTTRWRSSPQMISVALTPVRPTLCSQVRHSGQLCYFLF